MSFNKIGIDVVIETEQDTWLEEMVAKHSLIDKSKALRVLLDYAIEDGSEAEIFEHERCRFC